MRYGGAPTGAAPANITVNWSFYNPEASGSFSIARTSTLAQLKARLYAELVGWCRTNGVTNDYITGGNFTAWQRGETYNPDQPVLIGSAEEFNGEQLLQDAGIFGQTDQNFTVNGKINFGE
jgi:hypothetical protein